MKAFAPLSALSLAALLATGCSTPLRPDPVAARGPFDALFNRVARAGGAGLLASGCAYRDEVGDDAIVVNPSVALLDETRGDATQFLTDQGVAPAPLRTAFTMPLCASFTPTSSDTIVVRTVVDDPAPRPYEPGTLMPPGRPANPPGLTEAIRHAYVAAFADSIDLDRVRVAPDLSPVTLSLTPQDRALLQNATGRSWLWLVGSVKVELSQGRVAANNMAAQTGLVGALVGMAMSSGAASATRAALVDLNTNTRVWRGEVAGEVPSYQFHESTSVWGDNLFAPILRTGMPPRVAAVPAAPTVVTTTATAAPGATPAAGAPKAGPTVSFVTLRKPLALRPTPSLDAAPTTLPPGTRVQVLSVPTAATPAAPTSWVKLGAGAAQGWAVTAEVMAQF